MERARFVCLPELQLALGRPVLRDGARDLPRSLWRKLYIMQDTLDADDVLLDLARRAHKPVLPSPLISTMRSISPSIAKALTSEPVVFSAYESTKPTRPASTPVVTSATIDNRAATKMIVEPTNSRRTASQRLTEILCARLMSVHCTKLRKRWSRT